jgi:hypothetical protein
MVIISANLSTCFCTIFNSIEINLLSIEFILVNDSNVCKAYVFTNDSINPPNSELIRMAFSSYLVFNPTSITNTPRVEINSSQLDTANNNINATIIIQYTFTVNSFSTVKSKDIHLSKISISIHY